MEASLIQLPSPNRASAGFIICGSRGPKGGLGASLLIAEQFGAPGVVMAKRHPLGYVDPNAWIAATRLGVNRKGITKSAKPRVINGGIRCRTINKSGPVSLFV